MKVSRTNKSTQECKRRITNAFPGKKLPAGYKWTRSKKGKIITWKLCGDKKVIAMVDNLGPSRRISLLSSSLAFSNPSEPQFPPPFKPTPKLLDKLVQKYQVHENPDPPDCPTCGMKYRDLKTGLDFRTVQDMLFVDDPDPTTWRHKGRHSVLGLWFEIKRGMWDEHLNLCGDYEGQQDWFEDFDPSDFAEY